MLKSNETRKLNVKSKNGEFFLIGFSYFYIVLTKTIFNFKNQSYEKLDHTNCVFNLPLFILLL